MDPFESSRFLRQPHRKSSRTANDSRFLLFIFLWSPSGSATRFFTLRFPLGSASSFFLQRQETTAATLDGTRPSWIISHFVLDGGAIGSWWFRSPAVPTLFSLCAGRRRSLTTATGATQEAERPDDRLCDTIHRFVRFWPMVHVAVTTLSLMAMTTMFAYHFLLILFTVCLHLAASLQRNWWPLTFNLSKHSMS